MGRCEDMAELNLKQIIDRLNAEFTGETRKLVFWYDERGGFLDDIDRMKLANAKIYKLEKGNQFYTKYYLEKVDTTTNYLIYAPFPKPPVSENHLEDTMLYSKRFYADRASLLLVGLGIEEKYKPVIEKHIKFFLNKERTQRFYDLEIENFNEENILIGLMSAVCRTRTCSFDEVVRVLLMDDDLEDNRFIAEFRKFDLLESFWKYAEQQFGYSSPSPDLGKFVISMFVTYADRYINAELPKAWKEFVSYKSSNIIVFMDNLMNNVLYQDKYDKLSAYVAEVLDAEGLLSMYDPETLAGCALFADIDIILIRWIKERLLEEDLAARLDNKNLFEICGMRSKMHFGRRYAKIYQMLCNAYFIISQANYEPLNGFKRIIDNYVANDYVIDYSYRKFYTNYDRLEDTSGLEELCELVENIYTNEYLGKLLPKWNDGLQEQDALTVIPLQRNFFNDYIRLNKERTVVIISDGMRFEVGCELFKRMRDNPKCKDSLYIKPMLSVLPSYTRLGMEALLPHKALELTDGFKELVDGKHAVDIVHGIAVVGRSSGFEYVACPFKSFPDGCAAVCAGVLGHYSAHSLGCGLGDGGIALAAVCKHKRLVGAGRCEAAEHQRFCRGIGGRFESLAVQVVFLCGGVFAGTDKLGVTGEKVGTVVAYGDSVEYGGHAAVVYFGKCLQGGFLDVACVLLIGFVKRVDSFRCATEGQNGIIHLWCL